MHRRLLLLLTGCFVGCQAAFDAEKAEIGVQIVGTVVTITLPENPDVKSVFFSTELTDECAAGFIFAQSLNDTSLTGYKHDLKRQLNANDVLRVSGVFEVKEQVITHSYEFRIDASGQGVKQKSAVPSNLTCERQPKLHLGPRNQGDCIPAEWNHEGTEQCSGSLIFEETFNDTKLTKWVRAVYTTLNGPHREYSAYVKDKCTVENGQLHLQANITKWNSFYLRDCNAESKTIKKCGPLIRTGNYPLTPFTSARIQTTNQTNLKYGRYEIRAKMPKGDFLFPYIMMLPKGANIDADPGKHIRIAYVRGNTHLKDVANNDIGGRTVFGSVMYEVFHGMLHEVKASMTHKVHGKHFGDDFHTYTMIWHKDRIIFKVDGITYGTITDKRALKHLNAPNFYNLVLGLTVGGIYNYPIHQVKFDTGFRFEFVSAKSADHIKEYVKQKPWEQPKLVIDYVRVFATHPDED